MTALVYIATNRGDFGGGEVMLLHLAAALRDLGVDVHVVGPRQPAELVDRAQREGFATEAIAATDRRTYLLNLRAWDRKRAPGLLWCNGLLPAVATSGRSHRVVHLHQRPLGRQKVFAETARLGALATVVPSLSMAETMLGSRVLPNFVPAPVVAPTPGQELRLGFLGRLSHAKGTDVLGRAIRLLEPTMPGALRLVVGGESRFVGEGEANRIRRQLDELDTPVDWLGWVDPARFLSAIDVLVVPSTWPESFGLVVAEAMAAGVPVIVSDTGALPEVVGPDHPWVVPAGDPGALADALASFAASTPEQIRRAADAAQWRWADCFSPEVGKRRLEALLNHITSGTKRIPEGARA